MKINLLKAIGIVFLSLIFNSCSTLLYTSLDVLRPAKVTFAPEIKKILIINNSVIQPYDYGHKNEFLNEKVKNVYVVADSISIFCLGSLTEELNQKEFFKTVTLQPNSINRSFDFFSVKNLTSDTVTALCNRYKADAILSLDRIKVNDKITEYYVEDEKKFVADLEARFETQWSIHNPREVKFISATFMDTLFWESESYQKKKVSEKLPIRTDALIDGALYVGQSTVKKMVPYWDKVDRYFFNNSNKNMNRAMDSVYFKNWVSAISLWQKVINKSMFNNTKAMAANNIAIAYEIIGDIDNAIEYANQSLEYFGKSISTDYNSYLRVLNYLEDLNKRKKEIAMLKKQLAE